MSRKGFCNCGHAWALHAIEWETRSTGHCLLCECEKYEREEMTSEEKRAEIRRLSELVRRSVEAAQKGTLS